MHSFFFTLYISDTFTWLIYLENTIKIRIVHICISQIKFIKSAIANLSSLTNMDDIVYLYLDNLIPIVELDSYSD